MRHPVRCLMIAAICVWPAAMAQAQNQEAKPQARKAVMLFNGKDLAGWECFAVDKDVKTEDIWSVRDGLLICKGQPLGYLYTKQAYEDFKLIVVWRWAPGGEPGNSGILLRINGDAVSFLPKCVECQLRSGDAGALYGFYGVEVQGPAERSKVIQHEQLGKIFAVDKAKAAEKEPGRWNRAEITVQRNHLTVAINGQEVNQATCNAPAGRIGLQSEGGEIHFRTVRLIPLPRSAAAAEEEIVLFNGKDLRGWSFHSPDPDAKMENTFSVRDGVLCCTGRPPGYLQTDNKYTNYVLKLKWRWPKESKPGNNGVLLRIQPGEHFHGNVWPKSIEAQLAHTRAGDVFHIGGFPLKGDPQRTSGRRTARAHPSNEKPQGEWNQYEIILKGTTLTLKVNGLVQNVLTDVLEVPGTIGLQSEGAPIEYRDIRLIPLDD